MAEAATRAYERAPEQGPEEAYFAGFLHCLGLIRELESPHRDATKIIPAMRRHGFSGAVILAVLNFLEGGGWTRPQTWMSSGDWPSV